MSAFLSATHLALALSNGIARAPKGGTVYQLPLTEDSATGYIVGGLVPSLGLHRNSVKRVRLFEPRNTATGAILGWCQHNWETITKADCVGWWMDDTGMVHIDVNAIHGDLDKALSAGDKLDQIEIFDLHTKRCLPVKATATA